VPEECKLSGEKDRSKLFSDIENWCLKHADHIVTVSKKMSAHFSRKYFANKSFIVLPFLSDVREVGGRNASAGKLRVVYAGGVQQWQNITPMLAAIEATIHNYEFVIYTSNQSEIREKLRLVLPSDQAEMVKVLSLPNEILINELMNADYGFLLRENSVINEVSCPTKLIEYISCGVVPILDSTAIGDFPEMGLAYIRLSDFKNGLMPTEAERVCMAGVNQYVLKRYRITCEVGMRDLVRLLFGRKKGPAYFIDDAHGISFNV
jgi:hypothetical protein